MNFGDAMLILGQLTPIVQILVKSAETSGVSGADKRAAVLDAVGAIYTGMKRLGMFSGVKEIRNVEWESIAPLVGLAIDSFVALYGRVGIFKKSVAK